MTTMNISQTETELQVIKKIMEDSRKIIVDNGWHYIFWGVVVTVALLANYIMALYRIGVNYQGMMWLVMMTSAWITEAVIEKRNRRKKGSSTFAGRMLGTLWFASGISMFIFGFIGAITKAYNPIFICSLYNKRCNPANQMASAACNRLVGRCDFYVYVSNHPYTFDLCTYGNFSSNNTRNYFI
jgi:hypothetical protein